MDSIQPVSYTHLDVYKRQKQNNLNASFNLKPFKFLTMEYRTRLLHKEVDGSGTEGVLSLIHI